jgi:hypothetical protein
MNIYVESNFVLELALSQAQSQSCENILAICESDQAGLEKTLPSLQKMEGFAIIGSLLRDMFYF